ncbi:MAG: sigma-70 family RNA polymerase sigma factor [Methylacidiphilales bacterium]|nr:sigma-70 family RNA polymerase sigma factor [Candidatus Methylacidiphilales bacterium]
MDTSRDYLQRLRSGEEAAWAELHRDHYPRLWSSVQRILHNPSLTDDVVQEAFIKAHRDIRRFEGQAQLGTWLYRIAVNQALDTIRKKQRTDRWLSFLSPTADDETQPVMPEGQVPPAVSTGLENKELRETIFEAMAELSVDHRAVVQLRLVDEMSLEETAQLLRCKPGTVNSRLHYACEHLRRKLGQAKKVTPQGT